MGENWDRLQRLLQDNGAEIRSDETGKWILYVKMYESRDIGNILTWLVSEFERAENLEKMARSE